MRTGSERTPAHTWHTCQVARVTSMRPDKMPQVGDPLGAMTTQLRIVGLRSFLSVPLRTYRLLLRQTMQCPEAEDQVAAIDADDLAVREDLGQCIEGDAVGRVVEGRNKDDPIGDVEVRVAGRQS